MKKLKIYNEVDGFRVPRARLGREFEVFLKKEKVGREFVVSLVFIGRKKMRELNEKWYGGKGVTDVLSFNYGDGVGEIYICVSEAERSGGVFVLFAHGLLHLAGYTHETEEKYGDMVERAEVICKKV